MIQDDPNVFHIYVDESGKTDRYFAVGAILLQKQSARKLAAFINETTAKYNQRHGKEIHWKDQANPALYSELGSSLIAFTQRPRKFRYRALIVESRKVIRNRAAGETFEDIIAKFVFTLVFMIARDVGATIDYYVYIDSPNGDERDDIATLCSLNNRYKSRFKSEVGPFKGVRFVRSEDSRLIQATDLITGAISYEMNGRHLAPNANAGKRQVFESMLAASNLETFTKPTKRWPPQFQILHFDFDKSSFTKFLPVSPHQRRLFR